MRIAALIGVLLVLTGCSSTNLNSVRTTWTGMWVKGSPFDTQTPGKMEVGAGYGSLTIVPMARGQGAQFSAVTYELVSGHPLFAEDIVIFPVGQDSILKLERQPQSVLKIPFLLDIKSGNDSNVVNPTRVTIEPR